MVMVIVIMMVMVGDRAMGEIALVGVDSGDDGIEGGRETRVEVVVMMVIMIIVRRARKLNKSTESNRVRLIQQSYSTYAISSSLERPVYLYLTEALIEFPSPEI